MVTPTDAQIVSTAFTDEPMTLQQLVHRTGLTKLRVNNALDELVDAGRIHTGSNNTWSLKPMRRSATAMSNIPVPPSPPAKKAPAAKKAAKKVPAKKAPAKKVAKAAKKAPAKTKGVVKSHSDIEERDNTALTIIAKAKDGLTKDELTEAMKLEAGLVNMSIYRLQRDGKIAKNAGVKGEGRQVKWVAV